jgi:hypothetical protein
MEMGSNWERRQVCECVCVLEVERWVNGKRGWIGDYIATKGEGRY